MVSRVTYADGSTLHYAYDKAGNLVRETDADGGITRYDYDLLGQLTNVLSADGTTTEYRYNADGEVVSELVRNIAFSDENETEGHYSNLVNTSSEPFVATAIRYPEDAFDSTKGRSATRPPVNKPTPKKPNSQAQDYAKARRQATTPTQEEYQQLLRLGYTGGYGQYANDKQRSNFPSPAEYMYNRQQGRPNYQTYGPVEVVRYQSGETRYRMSYAAAGAMPKVESVNPKQEYFCDMSGNPQLYIALGSVEVNIGSGWSYRIDSENSSTKTQRHIHVFHNGKEYSQNEDGSPHDQSRGSSGKLPKWVQKELTKRENWDYNGKNSSFFEHVEIKITESFTEYKFLDGTVVMEINSSSLVIDPERAYYSNGSTGLNYEQIPENIMPIPIFPNGYFAGLQINISPLPIPILP